MSLGRKNFLFFGSDHGGERGALLYGLIGTCRLNGIDPERYLHHILNVIADWPVSLVGELLPWRVTLPPVSYLSAVNAVVAVRLLRWGGKHEF